MLQFLFTRLWIVLLPLILYCIVMQARRKKAQKEGRPVPGFREGPLGLTVLASIVLLIASFVLMALGSHSTGSEYSPPRLENGNVVSGTIAP